MSTCQPVYLPIHLCGRRWACVGASRGLAGLRIRRWFFFFSFCNKRKSWIGDRRSKYPTATESHWHQYSTPIWGGTQHMLLSSPPRAADSSHSKFYSVLPWPGPPESPGCPGIRHTNPFLSPALCLCLTRCLLGSSLAWQFVCHGGMISKCKGNDWFISAKVTIMRWKSVQPKYRGVFCTLQAAISVQCSVRTRQ
jgi:hypothetical protein